MTVWSAPATLTRIRPLALSSGLIAAVAVYGLALGCGIDVVGQLGGASAPDASGDGTTTAPPSDGGIDPTGDASVDAPPTDAAGCSAWNARAFDPCAIPGPGAAVSIPAAQTVTYDTDIPGFVGGAATNPPTVVISQGGTPAVVIAVDTFFLSAGATMNVIGTRPLIIAAWGTIDVQGTLDVGSRRSASRVGAGANPAVCAATVAQAGDDETTTGGGSGGGGGGGFQGAGGIGGPGDSNRENPGGTGGGAVGTPAIVRGGCAGAASGKAGPDSNVTSPSNASTTAPGGAGGGAVHLAARQSITVGSLGRVLAGGAGGGGAPLHSAVGGGGGGSGGYVAFDAPSLAFAANARVAANGGGGGSSDAFVSTGDPGSDGLDSATAAPGGAVGSCARAGAVGSAGATLAGEAASQDEVACGGAGGGGGAGYVLVFGAGFVVPGAVVFSPPPTVVP